MAAAIIAVAVFLFLWPVLVGGKVMLPADNLYLSEPWKSFAGQMGVGTPQNHLVSDLIIQNYSWKTFAREMVRSGQLPLWNPYLLGGVPFLAAGQYGVLYPFGLLFYFLPLAYAYGYFTALHLFLAGLFMYALLRVLGSGRFGALFSGLSFAFTGFLVVSFLWPQVLSATVWLPLIILAVEMLIRQLLPAHEATRPASSPAILWALLGAVAIGMQVMAGHLEITFYVLFSAGFYAAARLLVELAARRRVAFVVSAGAALLAMVGLGLALAAAQLIPFAELIRENFRSGSATYTDVIGWALPKRRVLSFLMPDVFGNPSHHSYFDLSTFSFIPITRNYLGEAIVTIEADIKNYVEGCGYVGILPLVFAALALLLRRNRHSLILAVYAAFSLALAFGAPLYRLFFIIPGFDQLHTPFRWLYPFGFCAIVLAGLGADALVDRASNSRWPRLLGMALVVAGFAGLLGLVLSLAWQAQVIELAQGMLARSELLQRGFANGTTLYSYEWRNAVILTALLLLSGAVLLLARTNRQIAVLRWHVPLWQALALATLLGDLFVFGRGFNPSTDPRLLTFTPPSVAFLLQDREPYRITSFGYEDVLKPNTAMRYVIADMRGYDTVIPRQFVDYWNLMEEPHGLTYSMVHKLVRPESLASPQLDLLNVKYVLTTQYVSAPGMTLVYDQEIRIYRNDSVLPRAFFAPSAVLARSREEALALTRAAVGLYVDAAIVEAPETSVPAGSPASNGKVAIAAYSPNSVRLSVDTDGPGWVVLTDSYFSGWIAQVNGVEAPVYRAYGNFRAVPVAGAGRHDIIFKYSPMTFRVGLFASLIAALTIVVAAVFWGWARYYRGMHEMQTAQRVAKNSAVPIISSLFNKGLDFAFALLMLRVLGVENAGKFAYAVVVFGYFEIVVAFGLDTLVVREVSRDRSASSRYFSSALLVRAVLLAATTPLLLLLIGPLGEPLGIGWDISAALLLLMLGLIPSSVSSLCSSLFNANEEMEFPAAISIVTNILKVTFQAGALLAGWGFIGLAGVSVFVNVVTASLLWRLVAANLGRLRWQPELGLWRWMWGESLPLMINIMLATIFFRIDVFLLKPMQGDVVNGYYTTAYRFVNALNIIPAYFTMALFPVLSRYAKSALDSFSRAYTMSLRLLLLLAVPICVGTTLLADALIYILGGPQYLPHAAIALQVLIWFLPFSFINSVTQYVLIAVNQQRYLTLAFVIGASFNLLANLWAIPHYSYVGAAVVTILSELVLFAPFYYRTRQSTGPLPLVQLFWRPVVASAVMGVAMVGALRVNGLVAVAVGSVTYVLMLLLLRTFSEEDRMFALRLLRRGRSDAADATGAQRGAPSPSAVEPN